MKQGSGFVYLWKDTKRNKFYLGSHMGHPKDGYIGSNNRLLCAYKNRPETFKRRLLEQHQSIASKDLLKKEEAWLQLIKPEELGAKYYNEKRVAAGGDIVSHLSEEKRKRHREKSREASLKYWKNISEEDRKIRCSDIGKKRRAKVKTLRGGSMPGELNPFYSKTHSEQHKEFISKRNSIEKWRQKTYKVILKNGVSEIFDGVKAIREKYCKECSMKFETFIGTGNPVSSNRKASKQNPLYGAIIEIVK
jgi:hypothetical protein